MYTGCTRLFSLAENILFCGFILPRGDDFEVMQTHVLYFFTAVTCYGVWDDEVGYLCGIGNVGLSSWDDAR